VTVTKLPELKLVKSVGDDPVLSGDGKMATVTWTVQVGNVGLGDAQQTVLTDVLPDGASNIQVLDDSGRMFDPATGVWTVGALAAGDTVTLQFSAVLPASVLQTGVVTNSASVTDPMSPYMGGTGRNDTLQDDTDQWDAVDVALPLLRVHKSVVGDPVVNGATATITWAVQVANVGVGDAASVVATDVESAGVGNVQVVDSSQGMFDSSDGVWMIGYVSAGDTVTLVYSSEFPTGQVEGAGVTNTVSVSDPLSPYLGGTATNASVFDDTDQFDAVSVVLPPVVPDVVETGGGVVDDGWLGAGWLMVMGGVVVILLRRRMVC